jgi:hypothetical protein
MKNLIVMAVAILLSAGVFAQATETKTTVTKTETKVVTPATKYCCPQCDYCSAKAGSCPHHKVALTESETTVAYCCGHCDWTLPPVKGQCPHSTASLYKDGELKCAYCHDQAGKCPKCGMTMEKIEIKKKKG